MTDNVWTLAPDDDYAALEAADTAAGEAWERINQAMLDGLYAQSPDVADNQEEEL